MKKAMKEVIEQVEVLALETVTLEAGDIPGLGNVLKALETIEEALHRAKDESLESLLHKMKEFIEKVILCEISDLSPFETAISQLQEILRGKIKGKKRDQEIHTLLETLGPDPGEEPGEAADSGGKEMKEEGSPEKVSEEDQEIIRDFVMESLENLGTIEVSLMDLEQDPSDTEIINSIFRPFHTVKGVSGFLNLNRINRLAHISENLLDKARNGELRIVEEIIDVILESVDRLKRMIENVQASLDRGHPDEGDVDTGQLIAKIEYYLDQPKGSGKIPIGEMLVAKGMVSKTDVEDALDLQKEGADRKIGEILIDQKKVEARDVASALRDQRKLNIPVSLQVKIDIEKLDSVVDMVGEMAIAQSMLRQNEIIRESDDRKLDHIVNQLNQIISGLQRTAMSLRMVPIKNTFQKMLRLVRDLAKKAGKDVQLVMSGEDTEIDRNMVEEIYEPMVHMIRNSVDHGLERPEERKAANKLGQGTVSLKAYHKGGAIVIEIEDDGRGLNREKILEKAKSTGLVKEEEKLTDTEIHNLIFHPGFSTAEKITDVSGRGVGMDVVKSKIIDRLRGRVDVDSTPGKGTTVLIRLPLTLAIVDGMIVEVAGDRYIIPTLSIQESFRPRKEDYHTVKGKGEMIRVRESLIPLIRMDRLLGDNGNGSSKGEEKVPWEELVVVVEYQEKRSCLLVDELLGQEEVVIKSLGGYLKELKGIAGGAIMGDGRVGLIMDIAGIFNLATEE